MLARVAKRRRLRAGEFVYTQRIANTSTSRGGGPAPGARPRDITSPTRTPAAQEPMPQRSCACDVMVAWSGSPLKMKMWVYAGPPRGTEALDGLK